MNYEPFDQGKHLGLRPWPHGPERRAWEEAHGHDARVKCYVEYGCRVIEPTLEYKIEQLEREHRNLELLFAAMILEVGGQFHIPEHAIEYAQAGSLEIERLPINHLVRVAYTQPDEEQA